MIRYGGGGTLRPAHEREWFWVLLPKQKDLVCRGETLHLITSQMRYSNVFGKSNGAGVQIRRFIEIGKYS